MIITAYIIWVLYSMLEGIKEAFLYNLRDYNKKNPINEHIVFTIQRAVVLILVCYIDWRIMFIAPFAFPFFHDGAYYTTRNLLNNRIYPKRWFDQSNSSTARSTDFFTAEIRTIFAVISAVFTGIIQYAIWKGI